MMWWWLMLFLCSVARAHASCDTTTSTTVTTTTTTVSSATTTTGPLWPPSTPTASPVSCTQVDLFWNVASGATSYNIYQWQGSTGTWIVIGSSRTTEFVISNLTPGVTYFFAVASVDSNGRTSMMSNWVRVDMPPCATTSTTTSSTTTTSTTGTTLPPPVLTVDVSPVGCTCTDTTVDCSLRISWSDPNYPNVTVRIDRSRDNATWTTVLSQSAPGQASFDDHGLAENATYYYNVTELATGTTTQLMLVPIQGQPI